jgi:hypothetical protein
VKAKSDDIPNLSYAFAPELLEALEQLPETINDNGEARTIGSNEVTHLTRLLALLDSIHAREELSRDDLLFLYEVNEPIKGFDNEREPLIDDLLGTRDRKKDLNTMANCRPEHLTTDFTNLSIDTHVYVEDTGTKITLIDFREAKNQAKLPHLIELAEKLKETGSLAVPDLSFEGGIIDIQFDPEKIKDRQSAWRSFKEADNNSPSYIWPEWEKGEWKPPEGNNIEIVVLSYNNDPNTRKSSDKIVADMDRLGFRPLTLEETTLAGILEPKFTKTSSKYFVGLTQYTRVGSACVPNLYRDGGVRDLDGNGWDSEWNAWYCFLFVRKP